MEDKNKEGEKPSSNSENNINNDNIIEDEEYELKVINEKDIDKHSSSQVLKIESGSVINFSSIKNDHTFDILSNNTSNLDAEVLQIGGEKEKVLEDEFDSTNNLNNLSSLFYNYISKFDSDEVPEKANRQRSIYKLRLSCRSDNNADNNEPNNNIDDNINLYNIIKDQLTEVKNDTILYLDKIKQKLELKYNNFIKKINELLIEKENQLSKVLGGQNKNDNFINYANKNLFNQIDDILEIHDNIFSALEDHFNLLFSFLEQTSLIQQKKPIESFINNNSYDILNCWFLNKIDFNQINLSNIISNKELSDLCAGYLVKLHNKNINPTLTIQKSNKENLPIEIEILYKNVTRLNKLKFLDLDKKDVNEILNEINEIKKKNTNEGNNQNEERITNAKKLKSLSIIHSNILVDNLPKITFPALKKFKLKRSYTTFTYLFDYIFGETNSLIEITIEKIKMTDNSLRIFFDYLSKKKAILETLKNLSFKGNNITKVNFMDSNLKSFQLKNLQYLNLSKNNIYEFCPDNFKLFPELNVLDLTDNNISNNLLFQTIKREKNIKCLALLSNNIFIHNNRKNNIKYIKYISDVISVFEHKIKKVSFSLLFNKDNIEHLTKLKISPALKISISKLDLSFCGLNDENLWKFFRNNFGLLNLEELNLSNNFLTDNTFNLCSGIKGDILLEKLHMIDLSGNDIRCSNIFDIKGLDSFVDNHSELKKIKLQQTLFVDGLKKLVEGKDNKNEIKNIISKLYVKEIQLVVEKDLNECVNSNEIIKNLFSYKNKTY